MKHIKNIFKISIVLLFLLITAGSISAADTGLDDVSDNDDFELDEDLDDELNDDSDDFDEDFDEDLDDELDDDSDDFDEDFDEDLDDELDDDSDDFDYNGSDEIDYYNYSDFDYLKLKITYYLDKYGNATTYNWTEIDEFLNEYQIYLLKPSNYTLNQSAEGYETYLKIFDSITSTFGEYNLTENETEYLKFMVIFYLNHYGNVSANYTWNESESFSNFTLPICLLDRVFDWAMPTSISGSASSFHISNCNHLYVPLNNSTDVNQTLTTNQTSMEFQSSWDGGILIFLLFIVLMILLMI